MSGKPSINPSYSFFPSSSLLLIHQKQLPGSYTYNIPTCIPAGEYLLRIQSLAIHNPGKVSSPSCIIYLGIASPFYANTINNNKGSTPQWYISCGQVKVEGGGSTTPSPTVSIPGAFKATDPGYTANIYNNFHSVSTRKRGSFLQFTLRQVLLLT